MSAKRKRILHHSRGSLNVMAPWNLELGNTGFMVNDIIFFSGYFLTSHILHFFFQNLLRSVYSRYSFALLAFNACCAQSTDHR